MYKVIRRVCGDKDKLDTVYFLKFLVYEEELFYYRVERFKLCMRDRDSVGGLEERYG